MLCGIHYFITTLKTKIEVIILDRFKPYSAELHVLCKTMETKGLFLIWNHHKCLRYLFLIHLNTHVKGLRPLEIFYFLSAVTLFIHQNLPSTDGRFWRIKTGPELKGWLIVTLISTWSRLRLYHIIIIGATGVDPGSGGIDFRKVKVKVYSLISSLKTYHPTLHFTPWSRDLFIRVAFQHHGEHTVLQPFRRIELIVHIAISVRPGTHFYLSQVKHLRVKCLAQRHNILKMSRDWEGRNMIFL